MRVGLLVTCLCEGYRPSISDAAVKLLERGGCDVKIPKNQTCCGQPLLNAGDAIGAKKAVKRTIDVFDEFEAIVTPSGSCAATLASYPDVASRVRELSAFLTDDLDESARDAMLRDAQLPSPKRVVFHDACSGLRQIGLRNQPRDLLRRVRGLELVEMDDPDACCGFGGLFSIKHGDVSSRMAERKVEDLLRSKPDCLVGPDLGCLLNLAGKLRRMGESLEVGHYAELLASAIDPDHALAPSIGGRG